MIAITGRRRFEQVGRTHTMLSRGSYEPLLGFPYMDLSVMDSTFI